MLLLIECQLNISNHSICWPYSGIIYHLLIMLIFISSCQTTLYYSSYLESSYTESQFCRSRLLYNSCVHMYACFTLSFGIWTDRTLDPVRTQTWQPLSETLTSVTLSFSQLRYSSTPLIELLKFITSSGGLRTESLVSKSNVIGS